jgi:hypothetical protein
VAYQISAPILLRRAFLFLLAIGVCVAMTPFSAFATGSVTLAWNPSISMNVAGYKIYYGLASGVYNNTISAGSSTNVTVTGLVEGTTYYFAVTAVDALGVESQFSNETSYSVPTNSTPAAPPTLNPLSSLTINENAGLQTVNLSGITSGTANEAQTLTVTAVSSNPGLIPNPAVNCTSLNATETLSFTPASGSYGTATVTVTVNDNGAGNNLVTQSFTVTVNAVNQPPTLDPLSGGSVPTILMPPQTQTAENGCVVNLAARVTGYPPPTYQWFFNGNAIAGCTNRLCLSGIQASNVGAYTLVVSNACGAVTSAPAMLNVIAPVERRPVPAVNLMAQPGSSLGLDYCDVPGSTADWKTMATMTLSNTSQFYFDVSEPRPPQRFYRAWQTGTPGVVPSLNLNFVPAITLTGNVGGSLRLDYINAIGPTDAWVTLDTVTLTNMLQLYFDVSVLGQTARLYRIVPVP